MTKKKYVDIPTKFWTEWLDSDEEKRIKMIQKTMIARELYDRLLHILKGTKTNKKFLAYTTARQVNDFCQDLENSIFDRKS